MRYLSDQLLDEIQLLDVSSWVVLSEVGQFLNSIVVDLLLNWLGWNMQVLEGHGLASRIVGLHAEALESDIARVFHIDGSSLDVVAVDVGVSGLVHVEVLFVELSVVISLGDILGIELADVSSGGGTGSF